MQEQLQKLVHNYQVESITEAEFIPLLKEQDIEVKKNPQNKHRVLGTVLADQAIKAHIFFRNIKHTPSSEARLQASLNILSIYPKHKPENIFLAFMSSSHFFKLLSTELRKSPDQASN